MSDNFKCSFFMHLLQMLILHGYLLSVLNIVGCKNSRFAMLKYKTNCQVT